MVVVVLPDPFRGMGRGGTPWRPNSRVTPQGLNQRSKNGRSGAEDGAPERLGCGTVKEVSQILLRMSAGAAGRILPFYPA